jgi:hypothetical protein
MLFASFGMKITSDCIIFNQIDSTDIKTTRSCTGNVQSLLLYVNGEQYHSDISQYVLEDNDRILIFLGNTESVSKHQAYLESLKIPDIPRKTPQYSGNDITV